MDDGGWDPKWGPKPPPANFRMPREVDDSATRRRPASSWSIVSVFAAAMLINRIVAVAVAEGETFYAAGIYLLTSVAVVYSFWVGKRWARNLVAVGSVFSIFAAASALAYGQALPRAIKFVILADAAIGIVVLLGLSMPAVRAHFQGPDS